MVALFHMKHKTFMLVAGSFLLLAPLMFNYYRTTDNIGYLVLFALCGVLCLLCAWWAFRLLFREMRSSNLARIGRDEKDGRLTFDDDYFQVEINGQKASSSWKSIRRIGLLKQASLVFPRVALVIELEDSIWTLPEHLENFPEMLEEIRLRFGISNSRYYQDFANGDLDDLVVWEK